MKIKVLAEKITHRGGDAKKGDEIDVSDLDGAYFIANKYAVKAGEEVGKKPIAKKASKKSKKD